MRGQASIEFLVIFLVTLALVSFLITFLSSQKTSAQNILDSIKNIKKSEGAARAIEALYSNSIPMNFDFLEENISYRVEGNEFLVWYSGQVIEVGGVFIENKFEPV
ncbi:hypothetical protein HZC07_04300 [Candidatus Micrarchaeota archaeon]|nr:hypothetical protein [Candidatus Micrarchaeota archaeon]